jgi:hypothetical protein
MLVYTVFISCKRRSLISNLSDLTQLRHFSSFSGKVGQLACGGYVIIEPYSVRLIDPERIRQRKVVGSGADD